jgi:AbiV family abortive infection protein
MTTLEDDSLQRAIEAYIANADGLLSGAKRLSAEGLHRLAYHLGALALEEVGKSSIFAMRHVARQGGRERPGSISKALDDHVRQLFWAIWGPSIDSN